MSLIQEALKRRDDENSNIPPKAIPIVPPMTREPAARRPEVQDRTSLASPEASSRRGGWPLLVVSLLVVSVVALAAIALLVYSFRLLAGGGTPVQKPASAVEASTPLAATVEVTPAPSSAKPVQATVEPAAPVQKPVKPAVPPVPVAAVPASTAAVPALAVVSAAGVKEAAVPKKAALSEVSVVPVSKPMSSQSSWPTLKVVGVMTPGSANQVGAAIIDGNLVECGDEIRGVRVHAVDKLGVWFEFNKQTQFVRVGQTTL